MAAVATQDNALSHIDIAEGVAKCTAAASATDPELLELMMKQGMDPNAVHDFQKPNLEWLEVRHVRETNQGRS
jgi:hypothetical protein